MNKLTQSILFFVIGLVAIPAMSFAQVDIQTISAEPISVGVAPEVSVVSDVKLFDSNLRKGQKSDDVVALQEILATDPAIYPEGITSGYFGSLTESALKRLQAKYSLPQTGILDEATLKVIYPSNITLQVIQPNGGEVWKKGSYHRVLWRSTIGPILYQDREVVPAQAYDANVAIAKPDKAPFFPRVSVDLVRDSNPNFRYHLGTANLYDSGLGWTINERLPEAKDYRVQISVGPHVPCLYRLDDAVSDSELSIAHPCVETDLAYGGRDRSDRPFAIINGENEPPNAEVVEKIRIQLRSIETSLENVLRSIKQINALLGEL